MVWRDSDATVVNHGESRIVLCGDGDARAMLHDVLGDSGFDVVAVGSGHDAMTEIAAARPALVIVDTDVDPMGFLVCSMLRERYGELLPIVLVSGERTDTVDRVAGLLLGADDYVVKPYEPTEVIARLRRLLTRASAIRDAVSGHRPVEIKNPGLTPREQEVLSLLVQGLSQQDIARELVISSNTVAAHIQRILQKLGVRNRAQAIARAVRGGWLSGDAAPAAAVARSMSRELDEATRISARRARL